MSVYFVQAGEGGRIKIGYSPIPDQRIDHLRRFSGPDLIKLAVIEGSRRLENNVHKLLADHRAHNEWFEPTSEVLAVVRRAAAWHQCEGDRSDFERVEFTSKNLEYFSRLDGVVGQFARETRGWPYRYNCAVLAGLLMLTGHATIVRD
jgi:hypothetical protein